MSKQRLENEIRRMQKGLEDVRPDVHSEVMFQCLKFKKVPKNNKLKEVVRRIEDSYWMAMCGNALPLKPSDEWQQNHGTKCEGLEGLVVEPQHVPKVKKPHLKNQHTEIA